MNEKAKKLYIVLGLMFLSMLFTSNIFASEVYKIDPTHSTIGFAVKHLQVGITRGVFTDFSGEVEFDKENPDSFKIWIVINTQSIDTRLEARDNHLRGEHFFDVENYPTIFFSAQKLLEKDDAFEIIGELTMRGVSKEVSGLVYIRGPVKSPFGTETIGVSGETHVNRQDYGIYWNDVLPDGGFVVGNDVKIIIDIEASKKLK